MQPPDSSLVALLLDLFAGESVSYRHWLGRLSESQELLANLPGETVSLVELVSVSIQLLRNRGHIDDRFFRILLLARPTRSQAILDVRRLWCANPTTAVPPERVYQTECTPDLEDLTDLLLAGMTHVELASGEGRSLLLIVRIVQMRDTQPFIWSLNAPFSPSMQLRIGPRPVITIPTPHYFTSVGVRKAQIIDLVGGPSELTIVQCQPSLRRASLMIHRGDHYRDRVVYSLAPRVRFSYTRTLPGTLVLAHAPAVAAAPLLIWLRGVE